MAGPTETTRFRFWRWLIAFIGVIVPRRFHARFRQEWEAEMEYREELLARWNRLDWRNKLKLLWRSLGALWDALWLQQLRWEDEMIQDLRFGVRMLLKNKGFTLIAILTLALGIGANTAIFSVANTFLLRPLPIKDADRLVAVHNYIRSAPRTFWFSYPDYLELRKQAGAVVDLFGASHARLVLGASGSGNQIIREIKNKTVVDSWADKLDGHLVTGNYFSALGGKALLGRTLTPEDDQVAGTHPVVVLSHRFWQRRFGAAPDIVGRTIPINGSVLTVVGVAEAGFTGVGRAAPDVWIPLLMRDQLKPREDFLMVEGPYDPKENLLTRRDAFWLDVRGRLQPGVSRKQAESALTISFQQLNPELKQGRPDYTPDARIRLYTTSWVRMDERERITTIMSVATPLVKDAVWVFRAPLMDDPFEGVSRDDRYYPDDGSASIVNVNGRPVIKASGPGNVAASDIVAPTYFAALGVPLLYGRTFTEQDTLDEKAVVVVNEALARRHWSGENPIGKSILIDDRKWEIIGVAKNTRNTLRHAANEPFLYLPIPPNQGHLRLRLLVKSDAAPGALAATLRTTLQSLDPKLKIEVQQIGDRLNRAFGPLRAGASLASLAGVLALAMAVMGLYGVMAFVVVQRTREIGVRMALGAQAADVVRLVLREGLLLVIIGVALGLLISVAATRVLAAWLIGISPTDPLTFGVITLLLGLVALLACWIPSRRATKVDPLIALRHE